MFTVSINPSTLCNFTCNFCYLSPTQLKDKKRVNLKILAKRLDEVYEYHDIDQIDLYGGEVTLLPNDYANALIDILEKYTSSINVITNLSRSINKTPWLLRDSITLSVSWDYNCRERWDYVLHNILETPKQIHILMLMGECMSEWSHRAMEEVSNIFNGIGNIVSVEIKPYSENQSNQQPVSYIQYESFIKSWILANPSNSLKYEFVNENQIKSSLTRERNAFSDDHVYITPSGKFAVLEFDNNNREFFLELDSMEDYCDWTALEYARTETNEICTNCHHFGHCLSEHLREVIDLTNSCNGFRFLLDWYDKKS